MRRPWRPRKADADFAVELVKAEKMALRTKNVRG
jgi:hypothetical protein